MTAPNAEPLRVGIAGLGFGCTEYLPVIERMPEIKIVAGADLRPQALEAFRARYGGHAYSSIEELCADPNVEAIWISTPEDLHAEHSVMAAEHGKHLCIRKPMGLTPDECQRVVDAVERNGVKAVGGGQTQGTNPLMQTIRRMLLDGEIGRLRAINMWAYTGWMLSARKPEEYDERVGGGIIWRQAMHQIEAVRWLGGGMVRSVRAMAVRKPDFRPEAAGYYAAYIEFEDGTPATIVYNGYGYFDSVALTSWNEDRGQDRRTAARRALLSRAINELEEKEVTRFGALVAGIPSIPWEEPPPPGQRDTRGAPPGPWQPGNQGVFIVSCEAGDVRMSPDGLYVYDDNGRREISIARPTGPGMGFLTSEAMELYDAVRHGKQIFHDARWGMATAEVQWAIIQSANERREIMLKHQVPVPSGL